MRTQLQMLLMLSNYGGLNVWSMQESVRGENSYKLLARNMKGKDTYNTMVQIRG